MKVIVVNGVACSGKDSFVDYCLKELMPNGAKWSSVDFVKDVAKYCGWNGIKDEKGRKFLSDLKDLLTEWDDVPMKKLSEAVRNMKHRELKMKNPQFLFVFVREPEEIAKIVDKFAAVSVCVRNTEAEKVTPNNHADLEVLNYEYQFFIDNDGTLEDLQIAAKTFCERLLEM